MSIVAVSPLLHCIVLTLIPVAIYNVLLYHSSIVTLNTYNTARAHVQVLDGFECMSQSTCSALKLGSILAAALS